MPALPVRTLGDAECRVGYLVSHLVAFNDLEFAITMMLKTVVEADCAQYGIEQPYAEQTAGTSLS